MSTIGGIIQKEVLFRSGYVRIITGIAKGKKLEVLSGNEVRPTSDRVKEAVFSAIQFQLEGKKFLDLFSGSGQMGVEALSRRAHEAFFIDARRESIEIIKKNLKHVDLELNAKVINTDAESYLNSTNEIFDIAFLDPPYYSGEIQKVMPLLVNLMSKDGIIICENPSDEELPVEFGSFILCKTHIYGKIKINIYRREDVEE